VSTPRPRAASTRASGSEAHPEDVERRVRLGDGTTLVVRELTEADLPGLRQLYASLSVPDLHRRFFSGARPPDSFFDRWFDRTRDEGCGLVAVAIDDEGERIVADAGYVLLPNGSGELAITVDPTWRGWLGHYVLDALVEAARGRGVDTLEADVLLENREMLALLDARGSATIDHPDWNTVRVIIGTRGRVPSFPGPHDRPRVLVEVPGGRWHAEAAARDAGYQVLSCPGPRPGPGGHCPLLEGRRCPLADQADVVVLSLAVDGPGEAILRRHRTANPDTPVCVASHRQADLEAAEGLADEVMPITRDVAPLLAVLDRLTGGAPRREDPAEESALSS
jgi:RimJ/RimL family protein N-acetyltransferase